ncbi:hypothetical protein GGX14DRAFT_644422 [Mycena pura]|uniref:Uncharacterized protein n=1 Tax=Mycena pura TaxID=153505 RepID=A0AAD6YEN0_9AGAR|nr:hypothetical protein GGX14DRAFT_644422 [Mycena pura]
MFSETKIRRHQFKDKLYAPARDMHCFATLSFPVAGPHLQLKYFNILERFPYSSKHSTWTKGVARARSGLSWWSDAPGASNGHKSGSKRVFAGYGSSWHRRSLVYSPFGRPWRNFLLPPPRASMLSAAKVTGPPSTTDGKVKCDICGHLLGYGASEGTAIANLKKHQKEARRCLTAQAKLKSGLTAASTSRTPAAKFDFAGFFKHMAKVLAAPTVPRVPAAPPPSQALSPSPGIVSAANQHIKHLKNASKPPPSSSDTWSRDRRADPVTIYGNSRDITRERHSGDDSEHSTHGGKLDVRWLPLRIGWDEWPAEVGGVQVREMGSRCTSEAPGQCESRGPQAAGPCCHRANKGIGGSDWAASVKWAEGSVHGRRGLAQCGCVWWVLALLTWVAASSGKRESGRARAGIARARGRRLWWAARCVRGRRRRAVVCCSCGTWARTANVAGGGGDRWTAASSGQQPKSAAGCGRQWARTVTDVAEALKLGSRSRLVFIDPPHRLLCDERRPAGPVRSAGCGVPGSGRNSCATGWWGSQAAKLCCHQANTETAREGQTTARHGNSVTRPLQLPPWVSLSSTLMRGNEVMMVIYQLTAKLPVFTGTYGKLPRLMAGVTTIRGVI